MKFYVKINNEFYSQYSCSPNPTCGIPLLYSQYSCCCILKHQKKISLKPLLTHGIFNFIFRPWEKLYEKQRPKLFTRKLKIRRDLLKFILKYFLNCYIDRDRLYSLSHYIIFHSLSAHQGCQLSSRIFQALLRYEEYGHKYNQYIFYYYIYDRSDEKIILYTFCINLVDIFWFDIQL